MNEEAKLQREPESLSSKIAVLEASQSLVGLTSYDVPYDKCVLQGDGVIVETNLSDNSTTYLSTVIAPATLFKPTDGLLPRQVQFDVCLCDSKLYKGKLVACDFHYNLAALIVETDFPLRPATLTTLNDSVSIDINIDAEEEPQSHDFNPFGSLGQDTVLSLGSQPFGSLRHDPFQSLDPSPFQLRPHRNLFKVTSGTEIIFLRCSFSPPFSVAAACGVFRSYHFRPYSCKELYWVTCHGIERTYSGTVINLSGEVMGIVFSGSSFLPSNFVSRWWGHFKSNGKFCRPWVGVEIANLAEARLSFLEKFRNTFSDISTGVIVTEVEKDTPAYCSGIRLKDVIVKCGGKQVQSKIQFFESMWDNAGNSVELSILRASDGQLLDLSMPIGEATPTNFYRWELPVVTQLPWRSCEGCSCKEILDRESTDVKAAVLKVSPSIVSVITLDIPDDMIIRPSISDYKDGAGTYVFPGSGVIITTEDNSGNGSSYSNTIICPAYLFKRTNGVKPHQVDFIVRVSGGDVYKGQLLACDFHYNLAAITIISDSPLRPATLRHLTHPSSLDQQCHSHSHSRVKRPRHSDFNSSHVDSGNKIMLVQRSWSHEYDIFVSTGVLSTHGKFVRKEMFSISGSKPGRGGAIINYLGEVIGICFDNSSFLPLNLVSRWWNHYQSCREFRRPCLGVKVVNLHEARTNVLIQLVRKFPTIVTGVVVTKVEKNRSSHQFGIESGDVIIKFDGDIVRSKLEFCEKVWDTSGRVVELDVLKARNGDHLKLSVTIGKGNLYKWWLPDPYYSFGESAHRSL